MDERECLIGLDVVVLAADDGALKAVLRDSPDGMTLPGGALLAGEDPEAGAARILKEQVGLDGAYLEQLYTFGALPSDPRPRKLSIAYLVLAPVEELAGRRDLVRIRVPWEGEVGGPVEAVDRTGEPLTLAFDHADVLGLAVKRIRGKLGYTTIAYSLLPKAFTLRQLQEVHETVLGRPLNKDSFRRRILTTGELEATGELEQDVEHRPAQHYSFTGRSTNWWS